MTSAATVAPNDAMQASAAGIGYILALAYTELHGTLDAADQKAFLAPEAKEFHVRRPTGPHGLAGPPHDDLHLGVGHDHCQNVCNIPFKICARHLGPRGVCTDRQPARGVPHASVPASDHRSSPSAVPSTGCLDEP